MIRRPTSWVVFGTCRDTNELAARAPGTRKRARTNFPGEGGAAQFVASSRRYIVFSGSWTEKSSPERVPATWLTAYPAGSRRVALARAGLRTARPTSELTIRHGGVPVFTISKP